MANPQTDGHAREQTRRDDQAHKNAEAARAGVEKLADHRQRATADAWKSMENSVDAASQGFQNASDQFARDLGYSGEEGKWLARQSAQDVEAITKYGTVLAEAAQDSSRQWYWSIEQLNRIGWITGRMLMQAGSDSVFVSDDILVIGFSLRDAPASRFVVRLHNGQEVVPAATTPTDAIFGAPVAITELESIAVQFADPQDASTSLVLQLNLLGTVMPQLHWQLDVSFDEDAARTRKDYGPENLALLRRIALDILRAHPDKRSIKRKMNLARLSRTYFNELFAHMR